MWPNLPQGTPPGPPLLRPTCPFFSSGPCVKPTGWEEELCDNALVGRSHRSSEGVRRIREVVRQTREILEIPDAYQVALVPGSATGAMTAALWNFLGRRGVDLWTWDVFGDRWVEEVQDRLRVEDVRVFEGKGGDLPDFDQADCARDQVFTWCGTTSGLWLDQADWIAEHRSGLTICDATSAVFTTALPWDRCDATVFSWQKGLGAEAGLGVVVLSPHAMARLEEASPAFPIPRILDLRTHGAAGQGIFDGLLVNTSSLLGIEDVHYALSWMQESGGLKGAIARVNHHFDLLKAWVEATPWIAFAAARPEICARSAVVLTLEDPHFQAQSLTYQWGVLRAMEALLNREGVAFDFLNHAEAFPGIRLWCGPTLEAENLNRLLPWLSWAWTQVASFQHQDLDLSGEELG